MPDLYYDGQRLSWPGYGTFKATSGMTSWQDPNRQCEPDRGPVPEGSYRLQLKIDSDYAKDDGSGTCTLIPASAMQHIRRGPAAGACEVFWANWGHRRVRLHPADAGTRAKCGSSRSGFYLHDSTKGYSHGCIEVDGAFFNYYMSVVASQPSKNPKRWLTLTVKYNPGLPTNGGTKRP